MYALNLFLGRSWDLMICDGFSLPYSKKKDNRYYTASTKVEQILMYIYPRTPSDILT